MVEPEQCAADLILARRYPSDIPAGAWCRGLNGMLASDAAIRRPTAAPQGRWCCSAMLTAARLLFCCGECCLIGSPSPRARCECTRQLGSSAAVWV